MAAQARLLQSTTPAGVQMSNQKLDSDQLRELLEIDHIRRSRGEPGIRMEVQELISRLKSGGIAGKYDDERTKQAKRLWDLGFPMGIHWFNGEESRSTFNSFLTKVPPFPIEKTSIGKWLLVMRTNDAQLMRLLNVGLYNCNNEGRLTLELTGSFEVYWAHVIDLRGPFEGRWVNREEVPSGYNSIELVEALCYYAQFGNKVLGEFGDPIAVDGGQFAFYTDEYGPQLVRQVTSRRHPTLPEPNVFVKRLT